MNMTGKISTGLGKGTVCWHTIIWGWSGYGQDRVVMGTQKGRIARKASQGRDISKMRLER